MTKRLQNTIAESRWALPIVSIYSLAACLITGMVTQTMGLQLAMLTISAYMMVELNNVNSLIRVYSRMISSSFLVMTVMSLFLFKPVTTGFVQLCAISSLVLLFRTYQEQNATGRVFYAFFALGAASIFFVQVLFFVPIIWILMAVNLMAFSPKTLAASLIGIVAPYWFIAAYYAYMDMLPQLGTHFLGLLQFAKPFCFDALNYHHIVTLAFITLLALVGTVHFLMYSYQDRIKTRLFFEIFITLDICCFLFIVLQPQHFDYLLSMMIIFTAPLIGHFITLTHSRLSNLFFLLILFASLFITAYNSWTSSTIF